VRCGGAVRCGAARQRRCGGAARCGEAEAVPAHTVLFGGLARLTMARLTMARLTVAVRTRAVRRVRGRVRGS
jgi:hypothetical protein